MLTAVCASPRMANHHWKGRG